MAQPAPDFFAVDVVDDVVVRRLLALRDQVAKPGEDVLGELLQLFERDSQLRLVALKDAVAHGDADARKSAAHALKGSAGNVGARRVAAMAAHIEKQDVDVDALDRLAAEIAAAIDALGGRLRA